MRRISKESQQKPRWVTQARWKREVQHLKYRKRLKKKHKEEAQYLYGRLNIIDAKSSALLTFNGIALAGLSLLADNLLPKGVQPLVVQFIFVLALVMWFVSTFMCLIIIGLRWPRLNPIGKNDTGFSEYCKEFLEESAKRTGFYRLARICILLAFLIATCGFLLAQLLKLICLQE